jgi:two-component system, NtrC family, response regulator AtoC
MATLLVIEDEQVLAKNIARYFEKQGHTVEVALDGMQGLQIATQIRPDVVIVDFQLPGMDGLEIIRALNKMESPPRIVMVTGHASVTLAVDAMKAGSMDLLTKPVTLTSLHEVVQRALTERGERRALEFYRKRDAREASLDALVGESPAMRSLRDLIRKIADTEPADLSPVAPVLVLGETGTGKELVARACHQAGPRAKAPFVEINCAALPAHLIEGELFGHEKGAFTDAQTRKIGLIEAADGGTLFLDEIGELDLGLQAKLLRVLENLRVRRLGALTDRQVNVRIIAATNRDLDEQVGSGKFRADLMYRLKVFQINIAPLRERATDIPLLAQHFLAQLAARYARTELCLDSRALTALVQYPWPGNVRELRNVLERAVLLQRGGVLAVEDLALPVQRPVPASPRTPIPPVGTSLESVEREHLLQALHASNWNVTQAARKLDISRDTLRYRMERHGLQK